jgi:uncharacterized YigZ family protein
MVYSKVVMDIMYRTVLCDAEGYYEEKKSRFIANVFRVSTEDDVLARIQEIRKRHYEARHHCFAYVLGPDRMKKRCSDDGEPQKTAGSPILQVLEGEEVTDTLIVVTRYFGGTLLGTGGLLRAYSDALKGALSQSVTVELKTGEILSVRMNYDVAEKLRYQAGRLGVRVLDESYDDACTFRFLLDASLGASFRKTAADLSAGKAAVSGGEAVLYYTEPKTGVYKLL